MLAEVADVFDRARAGEVIRVGVHLQHIVRHLAHLHAACLWPCQHDRHVGFALWHADKAGDGNDVEPDIRVLRGEVGHGGRNQETAEPFGHAEPDTSCGERAVIV